jgi:hypothetical protein
MATVLTISSNDPAAAKTIRTWATERVRLRCNNETDREIQEAIDLAASLDTDHVQQDQRPACRGCGHRMNVAEAMAAAVQRGLCTGCKVNERATANPATSSGTNSSVVPAATSPSAV